MLNKYLRTVPLFSPLVSLKLPVGLTIIIVNLPLFIFGYKLLGRKFAFRSVFIVFVPSALIMSFVRTKSLDTIQEGISSSKQCMIICESPKEIILELQNKLLR